MSKLFTGTPNRDEGHGVRDVAVPGVQAEGGDKMSDVPKRGKACRSGSGVGATSKKIGKYQDYLDFEIVANAEVTRRAAIDPIVKRVLKKRRKRQGTR